MKNKFHFFLFVLFLAAFTGSLFWLFTHWGITIFNPKGIIALQERSVLIKATLIMLAVIIPVFIITFFIAFKYKDNQTNSAYSPNMESGLWTGLALWGLSIAVIATLGIINWRSTHALDPHKVLSSKNPPLIVQVVALRWKWLFIYPQQNIATVNFLEFPENTPVSFQLTADDAPMNSFWIPQLGGQMYAMAGMENHLNLMADQAGEFDGRAAEISGRGFAGMRFKAKSVSQTDFDQWVKSVKDSNVPLTSDEYKKLILPSEDNQPASYSSVQNNLFGSLMQKYMAPANTENNQQMNMEGMK